MDKTETELVLHIGLPKTGTTAIQSYMSFNRHVYEASGIYWAETYPNGLQPVNDLAHHVYSHKWGGWLDVTKFIVTPDEAWRALGDTIRKKGGRHILSSERFADLLPGPLCESMLRFIVEAVAPAKVKLIGYVRRQDNLIESHVRELAKGGHLKLSLDHYLSNPPIFVMFDTSFLKAADILGKENVIVRVYERDRLVRQDAVADFLNACSLPELGVPPDPGRNPNPSINAITAKVLSDPRIIEAFATTPYRRAFVRDLLNQPAFDKLQGYALLGEEARADLMKRYEAGNARLAEMFLNESDASSLKYDEAKSPTTISDDDFVVTYQQFVDVLLALRPPLPQQKPQTTN